MPEHISTVMYILMNKNPYQPKKFGNAWDLYTPEDIEIDPGCSVTIPLNIRFNMSPEIFAYLYPRSSTFTKRGLLIPTGVIDSDYVEEVHLQAYNFKQEVCYIKRGERLVQILFHNITPIGMYHVTDFVKNNSRKGAIGSTGL